MSRTSSWTLRRGSRRIVAPVVIRNELKDHVLAKDCYPLALGYYEKALGHQMSRTKHDDNLLIYCYEGLGHVETANWQGVVESGQVLLLPAGVPHHYRADDDEPWSIYWSHFSGPLAREYIDQMGYDSARPVRDLGYSPAIIAQFREALQAARSAYNTKALIYVTHLLQQILTHIARDLYATDQGNKQEMGIEGVQALMLQNLDKSLSLEYLAEQAQLSKYHFSKLYKQQTGFAPIQHFLLMKIDYACYLLETSDSSVQDIAQKLGYDDPLYFSRLFKKVVGLAPRAYRKQ